MEDIKEKKREIRANLAKILNSLSEDDLSEKAKNIENRLFDFANFLESTVVLLYINRPNEVNTSRIIKRTYKQNKIVVLPSFDTDKYEMTMYKVDNPDTDLTLGWRGILEPDPSRCKHIPIDFIDIAIIPGLAFDEKGGRIGSGEGYYDRLIPKLPITTRKVSLSLENQVIQQVPMENNDRHVDIIITEDRIIYKI
ncbi:MAG: 5-formyltetrahydrofolate cyclo-ligase [Deltaproteobacteria bacterium]|nr:5-formyltetrahydrofolate cyclo-ligase [Deltaproteobacteria bacterium]